MMNEYIFIIHSLILTCATLIGVYIGPAALTTLVSLYCLLANIFVIKQITLFGLNATGSDAFTIGATLALNMLQEYYGKKVAWQAITINFFVLSLYTLLSYIHLWYQPNMFDSTQHHFHAILVHTPRIVIASVLVYFMAQAIDYYLYSFLKKYWTSRLLVVRNYISIMLSQLFDTIAFSLFGLYGIVEHIEQIIIISYTIKVIAIIISVPWLLISRTLMSIHNKK
ncbi:MAG TPA: queuosine precursor transporter [Candidatus Babeliales bacterium]|jgi:hypothetical protein|nr:queuosine precursor transporter [Candidatus Babeliales bacterium]